MNVIDITREWLKTHGADGLCCRDCGCGLDDLMPCGTPYASCEPGVVHVVTEDEAEKVYDQYEARQVIYVPMPKEKEE
jgi:hypothetical protein